MGETETGWQTHPSCDTIRQEHIPAGQFGRVNGAYRWLTGISNVTGIIAGGFLAEATSLTMPFVVGGALIVAGGVVGAVPLHRALRAV